VLRHNEAAFDIGRLTCRLMARADSRSEDRTLLNRLRRCLRRKQATYQLVLEAIESEASDMDRARAAAFYRPLKLLASRLERREVRLWHPCSMKITPTRNSRFEPLHQRPGMRILRTVNALAGPAGLPPVQPIAGKAQHSGKGSECFGAGASERRREWSKTTAQYALCKE
jgi:hypothetical protein